MGHKSRFLLFFINVYFNLIFPMFNEMKTQFNQYEVSEFFEGQSNFDTYQTRIDYEKLKKYCIEKDNQKIISLIEKNNKVENGYTLIHKACDNSNYILVELLIANGAKINQKDKYGNTPLYYAIENNQENINIVKILLQANAYPLSKNIKGENPLTRANTLSFLDRMAQESEKNPQEVVKLYPLIGKPRYSAINTISSLLSDKLKEIEDNKKLFFGAIEHEDFNLVKFYCTKMSLEIYDKNFNTPLHIAAKKRNLEIFKLILAIKPNLIGAKNKENKRPYDIFPDVLPLLVSNSNYN